MMMAIVIMTILIQCFELIYQYNLGGSAGGDSTEPSSSRISFKFAFISTAFGNFPNKIDFMK